jgi:hypothetical protein
VANIWLCSNEASPDEDSFDNLFLNNFILVHQHITNHHLGCLTLIPLHDGLFQQGVQPQQNRRDTQNSILKAAIGYARLVGVALMDEVANTNEMVRDALYLVKDC